MRTHRTAGRSFALASTSALAVALVLAAPRIASACPPPAGPFLKEYDAKPDDFGTCIDNPTSDGRGGMWEQFEFGFIDGISSEFGVWGLIANAWVTRYGGPPVTGQPVADEASTDYGALSIFEIETSCGGSGEVPCGAATFIAWNPAVGGGAKCTAHPDNVCEVYGAIGAAWHGLPILQGPEDEAFNDGHGHIRQDFQGGYINWNISDGGWCAENFANEVYEFTDFSAC